MLNPSSKLQGFQAQSSGAFLWFSGFHLRFLGGFGLAFVVRLIRAAAFKDKPNTPTYEPFQRPAALRTTAYRFSQDGLQTLRSVSTPLVSVLIRRHKITVIGCEQQVSS